MMHIAPFRAIRPTRDKVHLVASRSYVSYTPSSLRRKLSENPFSFIHIINPDFESKKSLRKNSRERFEMVKRKFEAFTRQKILKFDSQKCFYLYEQTTPTATFTGFIGGVSTEDYREGRIKKHEQTLTKREMMFCSYLDTCGFNAEPVLLTYRENIAALEAFKATKKLERPDYEFTTTDKILHRLWPVCDQDEIAQISRGLEKIEALYIADGHHRMASSSLLSEKRAAENSKHTGSEDYNFTMAMIMQGDSLKISPFHRLIRKGFNHTDEELLHRLSQDFEVVQCRKCFLPDDKRKFGLRLKSGWYELRLRQYEGDRTAVSHLDSVILTKTILEPVYKILDQKTDKRIEFIPGNHPLTMYENMIDQGQASAMFTLYEVTSEELYAISDEGSTMPPKSTFIEPKLRSGLTIMALE